GALAGAVAGVRAGAVLVVDADLEAVDDLGILLLGGRAELDLDRPSGDDAGHATRLLVEQRQRAVDQERAQARRAERLDPELRPFERRLELLDARRDLVGVGGGARVPAPGLLSQRGVRAPLRLQLRDLGLVVGRAPPPDRDVRLRPDALVERGLGDGHGAARRLQRFAGGGEEVVRFGLDVDRNDVLRLQALELGT